MSSQLETSFSSNSLVMDEPFWTVEDLAKLLRVSQVWVYKLVRQKRVPFYHVERCIRFSPSEIRQWLEERRFKEWRRSQNLFFVLHSTLGRPKRGAVSFGGSRSAG